MAKKGATPKSTPSRAEQVRQRREKRAQKGAKKKKRGGWGGSTKKTAQNAPVFMRTGSATVPIRKIRHEKAKRRYDLVIGDSGTEIRLPAFPQLRFGWRAISGTISVLLLSLLWWMWNAPAYQVSAADVVGVERLSAEDVNIVLQWSNTPIFTLDPEQMELFLAQAFPEFSSVEVELAFTNHVTVIVEERQPILAWQEGNRTTWVGSDGVAFPPRGERVDLPLVVSKVSLGEAYTAQDDFSVEGEYKPLLPLDLVTAVKYVSGFSPEGVALIYDDQRGLGWEASGGWKVYFGLNPTDMHERILIYQALVEELNGSDIQPAMISVEYMHAPYYTLDD